MKLLSKLGSPSGIGDLNRFWLSYLGPLYVNIMKLSSKLGSPSGIGDHNRFWLSYLGSFVYLLPQTFKSFAFPLFLERYGYDKDFFAFWVWLWYSAI